MLALLHTISECRLLQRVGHSTEKLRALYAQVFLLLAVSFCANIYYISQDPRLLDKLELLKPGLLILPSYSFMYLLRKLSSRQDSRSSNLWGIITALSAWLCTFYFKDSLTNTNLIIICSGLLSTVVVFQLAQHIGFRGLLSTKFIRCIRGFHVASEMNNIASNKVCNDVSEDFPPPEELVSSYTAFGSSAEQSSSSTDSLEESNTEEQESVNMRPYGETVLHASPKVPKFPETYRPRSASLTFSEATDDVEHCEYSSSAEECPGKKANHPLFRLYKGAKSFVQSAGKFSKSHSDSELNRLEMSRNESPRMSSSEYESSGEHSADETEDMALYCVGGYHPTVQGEIFNYRYVALEKTGWGECSIVWIAKDTQDSDKLVALKISRASAPHKNCATNEAHICTIMRDRLKRAGADVNEMRLNSSCVMEMYDSFEHEGPNGVHFVSVLEHLGPNLLSLMSRTGFRGLPTNIVRFITKRILHGLTFLHDEVNVTHMDIKPENILLVKEPIDEPAPLFLTYSVKISDLGSGRIMDYTYPITLQPTREYRAPEVLMGCESIINQAVDVWSLGCVVFELLTGDFLFDPKALGVSGRALDLLQMNLIMQVCGAVPKNMLHCARYGSHFFRKGTYVQERLPSVQLKDVMVSSYNMNVQEAESFCDFLLPMLDIDPLKRVKARDHTQHEWLQLTADELNEELSLHGV
ncbi:serine/threonine-protein kinase SRPK1-like protein [Perkinsela sp. CCAP 1560/4]|nr:serine/threonine-protein kinase SRPK1-like protein [Perkinsela sp. CCAP 1560/4]|eukprot:KNH06100.1 serine/threonine-protein kinase SRPK1-like protein [Perkinsela sp. CCAP 1560/4]